MKSPFLEVPGAAVPERSALSFCPAALFAARSQLSLKVEFPAQPPMWTKARVGERRDRNEGKVGSRSRRTAAVYSP